MFGLFSRQKPRPEPEPIRPPVSFMVTLSN